MLESWTTLAHVDGQWRIYSNGCAAFVPLEKALPELVAACPGAREKLEELDLERFKLKNMKKKITDIVYKILRREIENEDGFSYGTDLSEVAAEIAEKVLAVVEQKSEMQAHTTNLLAAIKPPTS